MNEMEWDWTSLSQSFVQIVAKSKMAEFKMVASKESWDQSELRLSLNPEMEEECQEWIWEIMTS